MENAIPQERSRLVVKHNDLINNTRYDLSGQEQKIIAYLISKVRPLDEVLLDYEFHYNEFLELCGTTIQGGKARSYLKETLKKLRDKSFYITRPDGKEALCSWINKVVFDYSTNSVMLRLDEDIAPLLLMLQEKFAEYELYWILAMTSGYSIRIYEIMKAQSLGFSYSKAVKVKYSVEELKSKLGLEKKYSNTGSFTSKIIDVACREINRLSDMKISYEKIKEGKAIRYLEFVITGKNTGERMVAMEENEKARGGQLMLDGEPKL